MEMSKKKPEKQVKKSQKEGDRDYAMFKDPYSLDEVDRQIIKHVIEFPRTPKAELCKKFNFSYRHLAARMKKPAVVKAFEDIFAKTMEIIEKNNNLAAR